MPPLLRFELHVIYFIITFAANSIKDRLPFDFGRLCHFYFLWILRLISLKSLKYCYIYVLNNVELKRIIYIFIEF